MWLIGLIWDAPHFRQKAPKKAPHNFSKIFWPPKPFLLHFYASIFWDIKYFEEKNFKNFLECLILQFYCIFFKKIIQKWWFLTYFGKAPPEILSANSAIWNYRRHLDLQKRPFGAKAPILITLLARRSHHPPRRPRRLALFTYCLNRKDLKTETRNLPINFKLWMFLKFLIINKLLIYFLKNIFLIWFRANIFTSPCFRALAVCSLFFSSLGVFLAPKLFPG